MRIKRVIAPVLVTLLLGVFLWAAMIRIVAMIKTGHPLMVSIGIAISLVLFTLVYAIVSEWRTALVVSHMGDELGRQGKLVADTLTRSPGGRIDRGVADEQFESIRQTAESNPDDYAALYNLAFAYDACGDRKRARSTLRQAAKLYRQRDHKVRN